MESRKRHFMKTVSWRLIGTSTTFIITWAVTRKIVFGAIIGGLDATVKMILYYIHERAWHKSGYGISFHDYQEDEQL